MADKIWKLSPYTLKNRESFLPDHLFMSRKFEYLDYISLFHLIWSGIYQ